MPKPTMIKGHKWQMFFMLHKIKIIIIGAVILLVALAALGLSMLESFYRTILLASAPFNLMFAAASAAMFVFMYVFFLHGGLAKAKKGTIKNKLAASSPMLRM